MDQYRNNEDATASQGLLEIGVHGCGLTGSFVRNSLLLRFFPRHLVGKKASALLARAFHTEQSGTRRCIRIAVSGQNRLPEARVRGSDPSAVRDLAPARGAPSPVRRATALTVPDTVYPTVTSAFSNNVKLRPGDP